MIDRFDITDGQVCYRWSDSSVKLRKYGLEHRVQEVTISWSPQFIMYVRVGSPGYENLQT